MNRLVSYDSSSSSSSSDDEDHPDISMSNVKDAELGKINHDSPATNSDDKNLCETNAKNVDTKMEDVSFLGEVSNNKENLLNEYRQQIPMDVSVNEDDCSSSSSSDDEDISSSSSSDSSDSSSSSSDESELNLTAAESDDESSGLCLNATTESNKLPRFIESTNDKICGYCIDLKKSSNKSTEAINNNFEANSSNNATKSNSGEGTNLNHDAASNICKTTTMEIEISNDVSEDVANNSKHNTVSNLNTADCNNDDNKSNNSCTCGQNKKEQNPINNATQAKKVKRVKKKATFEEIELPSIENLHISVDESEAKPIGKILHFVQNMVVVQTYPGIQAINLDSVLFLDNGKRALGHVANVFGHIFEPHYVVNFNSPEDIKLRNINKGDVVYYAPQTEHTSFIILDDLLSAKGSDASWKDDQEPPLHCLDYSDDEKEREAKAALKAKKKQTKGEQVIIVGEFESRRKKARVERRNPFSQNFQGRSSYPRPRYTTSQFDSNLPNSGFQKSFNDFRPSSVRFGGPPNLREGSHSPFASQGLGFNNGSRDWNGGLMASSSGFHSGQTEQNGFLPDVRTPPPSHNISSNYNFAIPPSSSPIIFNVPPPPISQPSNNSFRPPQIHNPSPLHTPPPPLHTPPPPLYTPPPPFHTQGFPSPILNQPPPNQQGYTPQAVFHNQSVPPLHMSPNIQHPVGHMPPPFPSPNIPQMPHQHTSSNMQHASPYMQNPSQCLPPNHPQYRQPSFPNIHPNNNQDPSHIPSNSPPPTFRPPHEY